MSAARPPEGARTEARSAKVLQCGSVDVQLHGRVAVITLCNERRLNAIDLDLARGLVDAVTGLASREDVGALVLRGAGRRAFCAGLDMTYANETGDRAKAVRTISGALDEFMNAMAALDLPSVAMLHGACYGGGVHLAINADFRFADEALACAVPALKNRLYYPVAALVRLRELCGPGRTARLLLEGEAMDASTLLRWGLVDEVLPADRLEAATMDFAARLAAQPARAMRDYRAIFRALDDGDVARASEIRAAALARPAPA